MEKKRKIAETRVCRGCGVLCTDDVYNWSAAHSKKRCRYSGRMWSSLRPCAVFLLPPVPFQRCPEFCCCGKTVRSGLSLDAVTELKILCFQIIEKGPGHSRSRVFREVEMLYQCQGHR